MYPAMNQKQMTVAKQLCKKIDTKFNEAINDKILWNNEIYDVYLQYKPIDTDRSCLSN